MSLRMGDELVFDGAVGRIVEVTDTIEGDGRGSIAYEGQTFRFRVLQATGPDVPLAATGDPYFRVGLLAKAGTGPLFALVVDDLPAPSGWGRWIQQEHWMEASELEAEDSVVFVLGWKPGEITIRRGGEPQAGVFADLVLTYSTSDGDHEAWYQPAYPYNDLQEGWDGVPLRGPDKLGSFKTDEDGILWAHRPDGTLEPIILPRGFGALGQRAEDTWPGAPEPERVLTKVEVWYLQEHAEVAEGEAVTLDVAAVDLHITGPPYAKVELLWEGSLARPEASGAGQLDGSGEAVETGFPVGRYVVWLHHPSDPTKYLEPQAVNAYTSGHYDVTFSGSWSSLAGGVTLAGVVYRDDLEPAGGTVLYYQTGMGDWEVLTTCDEDGKFSWSGGLGTSWVVAVHPEFGSCAINVTTPPAWWSVNLSGRFGAIATGDTEVEPENLEPWGVAGPHENLPVGGGWGYMKCEETEEVYPLVRRDSGAVVSEPAPRWRWDPNSPAFTLYHYSLYSADDELIGSGLVLAGDEVPPWTGSDWWERGTLGGKLQATLGGKIEGNVVEASRNDEITPENYPEAARMGLEFGTWRQPLEARLGSETIAPDPAPLTFQAWECPYCGGPAWKGPDAEGYVRGTCMQCADHNVQTDCRTYFITPTLSAADDWKLRWVRNTTAGGHRDKVIQGWPRPEEYDETDAYLVWDWQGFGLPRWVAIHIVLGTWDGEAFTDGESIADVEARLGRTVGPVHLKLVTTEANVGGDIVVTVSATRSTEASEALTGIIPASAPEGTLVPLAWQPHDRPPPGGRWYTDVTDCEAASGGPAFLIVNDGPAWHGDGVTVTRSAHSPFACDLGFGGRDPFLVEDFGGRLHLVYIREGQLLHRTLEGTCASWSDPVSVTALANWPHPCSAPSLAPLPHAELLAAADTLGATRLWRSNDDGERWE